MGLFKAGGGVDPTAPDATGLNALALALALAESIGAPWITALLQPTAPAAAVTPPVATPIAAPVPSNTPSAEAVAAAAQQIPPELKAQIDAQVDSMDLPPAEKEAARARGYLNIQSLLRSVDSIKAMAPPQ